MPDGNESSRKIARPARPKLVVCDEPVSALDLSIQAQILNLPVDLKKDFGRACLCISHDLLVVRYFADRVAVMYLGRIVESADHAIRWRNPRQPRYGCLAGVDSVGETGQEAGGRAYREAGQDILERGCRLRACCPAAVKPCETDDLALRKLPDGNAGGCNLA